MPEVDHRIDVGMLGDQRHHFGNGVADLATGAVHRVVAAPTGRQLVVDRRLQVGRQVHQHDVGVAGDRVGGDHAPAAGGGEHDRVRTARQRLGGECRRRLVGLGDRRGAGDAGGSALAVEDLVVRGQRSGVAGGSLRTTLGGATLDQHERLAGRCAGQTGPSGHGRRRSPRRRPARPLVAGSSAYQSR